MKKSIIPGIIFSICYLPSWGQVDSTSLKKALDHKIATTQEAADQKRNFKSIVTDLIGGRYYQLLMKNGVLNQNDGELQFKSTIYGLIRLFDSTREEQKYFRKYRLARNIQIGSGVKFGENSKLDAANFSLSIAIVNQRELRVNKNGDSPFDHINDGDLIERILKTLSDKVDVIVETNVNAETDLDKRKLLMDKYKEMFMEFEKNTDFSVFRKYLTDAEFESLNADWGKITYRWDSIARKLSGGLLFTFSSNGNYNGKNWENVENKLEAIWGLGSKKDTVMNYDFYLGAINHFTQDTLNKSSFLNRHEYIGKVGVNKVVWKDKDDGASILEAFGGAEYMYVDKGTYAKEKNNNFKLDMNISVRLMKNLYLPFQVKYNPVSGRFEGYVDLKFDIVNIFK